MKDIENLYLEVDHIKDQLQEQREIQEETLLELFRQIHCIKQNMLRIKNQEPLNDSIILQNLPYNDLSPEAAHRLQSDPDKDFQVIDVSEVIPNGKAIEGAHHIPFSQLEGCEQEDLPSSSGNYLVISENGTKSILACHELFYRGFKRLINVSGGHLYSVKK